MMLMVLARLSLLLAMLVEGVTGREALMRGEDLEPCPMTCLAPSSCHGWARPFLI